MIIVRLTTIFPQYLIYEIKKRDRPQSFLHRASPQSWQATCPASSVLLRRLPEKIIDDIWIFDICMFDFGIFDIRIFYFGIFDICLFDFGIFDIWGIVVELLIQPNIFQFL